MSFKSRRLKVERLQRAWELYRTLMAARAQRAHSDTCVLIAGDGQGLQITDQKIQDGPGEWPRSGSYDVTRGIYGRRGCCADGDAARSGLG